MDTFHVKRFYLYKLIGQCLPIYAFYTLLFLQRGMSVSDIGLLIALWSAFSIVFEVPSGILADRWNRRNMLALSAVLQGAGFIIWFFSNTFFGFALGFAFWAVAGAFTSGTEEGLLYDNLKSDGTQARFAEIYGKAQLYANVGTVNGIASAGLFAQYVSVAHIALISAGICFVNAIIALSLREKNYYCEQLGEESAGFFATFAQAGTFLKGNKTALCTVLFLVFFVCIGSYLDEFDALIINDFRLEPVWVSVILTVRFVFTALGNVLAPKIQKKMHSLHQIFIGTSVANVFLLLFALVWRQVALLFFGAAFMGMTICEVLLVNLLQSEIREEGRATVLSFYGVGQNIVMICFSLIYAQLADMFTLQQVYLILAVYGMVGGMMFFLGMKARRGKHISPRQ